jgi:hypothetical protein
VDVLSQVVVGAQIPVKLPAMRLLDDENAFDALERCRESLGLNGK